MFLKYFAGYLDNNEYYSTCFHDCVCVTLSGEFHLLSHTAAESVYFTGPSLKLGGLESVHLEPGIEQSESC